MRNVAIAVLAALIGSIPGADADGMLDPSFGNGGLVTTNFPFLDSYDGANSLVVLPDGRAVAAGRAGDIKPPGAMAVARYLSSGALDGGLVTVSPDCEVAFGGPGNGAEAALLQPDGRLVLVGICANFDIPLVVPVFWLVRLNVDGSLDPSFGTGGQVYTPFPGGALDVSVAGLLQPDGRIVAMGWGNMAVMAARYNPDGSLDPTFGTAGQVTVPLAEYFVVRSAALQPDGKLVIGGTAAGDFGVVRLLPNGAPDPSFDGDGLVTSDFGASETGRSVTVLGDGRLVLAGSGTFTQDFAVVRYLADGTLDTSFGTGGLATANAGGDDVANQVLQLPNGKLFLAGHTNANAAGGRDFLLTRFHADGALDTSFGTAGFLQTDFGSGQDYCTAVALAGQDLILTAGYTWPPQDEPDFALARYIASTPVELLAFGVE